MVPTTGCLEWLTCCIFVVITTDSHDSSAAMLWLCFYRCRHPGIACELVGGRLAIGCNVVLMMGETVAAKAW